MSLELALRTHLLSKTSITDIVGTRVAFGNIEPSADALPGLLFRKLDGSFASTLDGDGEDLQFPFFEFECRSTKPSETVTLAALVRRALRELMTGATISTSVGNVDIAQLLISGEEDQATDYEGNGLSELIHSRSIVVQVGYRFAVSAVS